jgi:MoaA/NifB/PqqE/SkfB family radical SAM enzyme
MVFAPTRANLGEIQSAYDLAGVLGCEVFVTGPLMQLGRAALDWDRLGPPPEAWAVAEARLREHASRAGNDVELSIYPWDIVTEAVTRLASPQAMLLVVPNGRVKLLNALPFSAADLRRDSLAQAWSAYIRAWKDPRVRAFVERLPVEPTLLHHANEVWPLFDPAQREMAPTL